jgi:hypothetical protein
VSAEQLAEAVIVANLALGEYAATREAYRLTVWGNVQDYLYSDGAKVTRFKNAIKKEMLNAFTEAYDIGYLDGGGDPQDKEQADDQWLTAKMNAEIGYIDQLFAQMKELKGEAKDDPKVLQGEADKRADGYARTLDGVYSEGKIRGSKNIMLTFAGDDGAESCDTCQRLKGARHKASWWTRRGLTIFRGNTNYDCGCYNCQHFLHDDKGNIYTF